MPTTLETLPADHDQALQVKLRRLRELVDRGRTDLRLRRLAEQLVAGVPERDAAGERRAISRFVRRVRYTRDPVSVEYFQDPRILAPRALAGTAAGDCDDMVALGASLLEAVGHPTRFAVGGADGRWSHIWTEALDARSGRWHAVDDTRRDRPTGWSPAPFFPDQVRSNSSVVVADRGPRGAMATVPRGPRSPCYGGAAALQGLASGRTDYLCFGGAAPLQGLAGFSLKKLVKKVGKVLKPIAKLIATPVLAPLAAAPILPRSVRAAVTKALPGTVARITSSIAQISSAGTAALAPIVGGIVGGAAGAAGGQIVGNIVDRLSPDPQQPRLPSPQATPATLPTIRLPGRGVGILDVTTPYLPGTIPGAGAYGEPAPGAAPKPSWLPWLLLGGGALLLVATTRKRRR